MSTYSRSSCFSAYLCVLCASAVNSAYTAEDAEVRRGTQRYAEVRRGVTLVIGHKLFRLDRMFKREPREVDGPIKRERVV